MAAERVDGGLKVNFMRQATPEETNRYENGVGLSGKRPDNPGDVLLDIFQQRGYPFEFTPTDMFSAGMTVPGEAFDVFCYNPGFRANFKIREAIISQLPTFRFLSLIAQGEEADLELVEQIVEGNFVKQEKFPAVEHIELSPEEMRQCLARAYHARETFLVAEPDRYRKFMERDNQKSAAFEEQIMPVSQRTDMQMAQAQIERVAQEKRDRNEIELEAIRGKQQSLGVDPIPAKRIREVVTAFVDKTEGFIVGK